jgi:16S rRNA G966 N2-methylase RsmD
MKISKNINILKNINLLNQIFYFFVILLLTTFLRFNVQAHELWLEPINFKFNNKEISKIHINIGQNLMGASFGYYDPHKKSLHLENKNKVINLPQRNGNFPAIQTLILDKGFHIINYETNFEFLKYESLEKFEDFLNNQNFQSVLGKLDKNNLPTENYKRFAKALMTDGNKGFFIQKPKLDFEIIALNSPYNLNNNLFEFQLFEKGNPLKNWQITVFSRDKENSYKEIVKTNINGIGIIRVFKNRTYLLSSVKLEKANYIEKLKHKSDWFSFWASLTFKN